MNKIKKIYTCISCGSSLSDDIVMIGNQYPSAIFLLKNTIDNNQIPASSLNLCKCTNEFCQLVQLSTHYDLNYVFDNYPYQSGTTASMNEILKNFVDYCSAIVNLNNEDVVLDIGGNDGTMLSLFNKRVKARINIDAASGVGQVITEKDYIHIKALFNKDTYKKLNLQSPKLITCVAMFYHLNDPFTFIKDIKDIMDDRSIWVLQMTYLGNMLTDNIIDNIVHEHVAYYSLKSLKYIVEKAGLLVAEASIVESYGGSIRISVVKNKAAYPKDRWLKGISNIENNEIKYGTNTFHALEDFNVKVQLLRSTLKSLVEHIAEKYKPLWGFGASTKGNMLLQLINVNNNIIPYILDNSEKKIGTITSGTNIQIVDEDEYLKNSPNYLLVLPYYYEKKFIEIIRKKIVKGKAVTLLIPLPFPNFITVIGEENL